MQKHLTNLTQNENDGSFNLANFFNEVMSFDVAVSFSLAYNMKIKFNKTLLRTVQLQAKITERF